MTTNSEQLKQEILGLAAQYYASIQSTAPFRPGIDPVPVSGKVLDGADLQHILEASLDMWLTAGRFAAKFEQEFPKVMGAKHALLTNSGSSANLLAVTALSSPLLGKRRLLPGDEIITAAAGFPTTVNPIIQNGFIPVFIDSRLPTYNIDPDQIEQAIGPRTKAIIAAHTLGNPLDLTAIKRIADQHGLWLIEDACDAVGGRYAGKPIGSFGDLATASFYPAHHITMGEGGAVLTSNGRLRKIVESLRDWGRDCWCEPGKDNTCGKRFGWKLGELPFGYDHKYTYSHIGYNLKVTDMQAAAGVSQLAKLPAFIAARRQNFAYLHRALKPLEHFLILPEATPDSEPSWFGFPLTVRPESPLTRTALIQALEARNIGTRLLFGGNLLRQPAYSAIARRQPAPLPHADLIMQSTFWIGVYPGLTAEMLEFTVQTILGAFEGSA